MKPGGVIVTWNSSSSGSSHSLYAEHFNQSGTPQWQQSTGGITTFKNIVSSQIPEENPQMKGMSGTKLTTGDYVFIYPQTTNETDINYYAQKIDGTTGANLWSGNPSGIAVTTAAKLKHNPNILVSGTNIITAWDDDRNGNSDIYAQRINMNGTLPVKLTKFNAGHKQNTVALSWKTASETDNDHFEIERSENGLAFAHIGSVKGNKTTSALSDYVFTDRDLNDVTVNYLYYRLKQVDMNGQFGYSTAIPVKIPSLKSDLSLEVYPNPGSNIIHFMVRGVKNTSGSYKIYDVNGKVVLSSAYASTAEGINISVLPAGKYILEVNSGGSSWKEQLIKN